MTTTARSDANGTTDITEIGQEMWSYLTGKGASVEYTFEGLQIEVPKTTGPDALTLPGSRTCLRRTGSQRR